MEFNDEKKPQYIFRYPFRFVKPYEHVFETHAKQRWFGKQLLLTLVKQFKAYDEEYFRAAISQKRIRINKKPTTHEYKIKNGDLLTHETVRQEPPILDMPIKILHEDQSFLIVEKPPSMIVHTGGGYHYNTLLAILYYEMQKKNLYILHRLDRLTSGIIILAKSKEKSIIFHEESNKEVMKKMYYARVKGNVQFEEKILNEPIICLSHKEGIFSVYNETMKNLINKQNPLKQSSTKFVKLWYDEETDSSLLQCYPITGRTHQIRVHLKFLGHSILNDVVYDGKFVGNRIIKNVEQRQVEDKVQKKIKMSLQDKQVEANKKIKEEQFYDKWDFETRPWQICLHSFKYTFEAKDYEGNKPYWFEKSL